MLPTIRMKTAASVGDFARWANADAGTRRNAAPSSVDLTIHAVGVRAVARRLVARTEHLLDRVQEPFLALSPGFGQTGGGRRREPAERLAPLGEVLVVPERLVEAHRFAPVRQRKRRIDSFRLAKRHDGVVIFEAVKEQYAADERRLRRRRA